VAREHRISPTVVRLLVKKARQNPRFIEELITERDRTEQRRAQIASAVTELNEGGAVIDSVAMATKTL